VVIIFLHHSSGSFVQGCLRIHPCFFASKWLADQTHGLLKELEFQRLAAELDDEHQDLRAQVGVIKVAMDENHTQKPLKF